MESNPTITPTMPVIQSKSPVSYKDRMPLVYDYKKGTMIYPSKREVVLVEAWCRSFNYSECARVLEAEFGKKVSPITCMRWLNKSHVSEWKNGKLRERARVQGYTREHWISEGIAIERGEREVKESQGIAWKELGKACGFYEPDLNSQTNIQINFHEKA